jgi:2-polyprenyl-6-methoxyphenol hydroxylase-like FAD-dependent oxidoreductase
MSLKVDDRVPVLLVGGSLVGLSTSLFLGRLGIRHLLVERHAATSHPPARARQQRPDHGALPHRRGRAGHP